MTTTSLILIILGMSIVTYLPRLLPVFILDRLTLPPVVQKWLKSIPYAALGALIFPGVLKVDSAHPWVGAVGGAVAILLALLRVPILVVVIGAILTVWLVR